ncbi:unnamed protein product [Caenorhabditis brenneri]
MTTGVTPLIHPVEQTTCFASTMSVEISKSDITLLVDGREFYCLKETLSENSTYFQSMFFSNFVEKDKNKIEIEGFSLADFQLFLDAINDINSITDENVDNALALSAFLGSSELEKLCMTHLAQGSKIPLKEQFHVAEKYCSENLMIQVCSSIKDAYELDEVVPEDLDSFCNTTKNIVLRRSFELLGVRKPLLPPQPEDPIIAFEGLMGEFLDQADLQNHHGMILADQAALVKDHILYEEYIDRSIPQAKPLIQQDPRIHELMEELRNTHSPAERNAVRAQVLVVKYKNIYTTLIEMGESPEHQLIEKAFFILDELYRIIHRNQRDHSKPQPSVRGDLLIDHMYRRIIETVKERLATGAPQQNIGFEPIWVTKINKETEVLFPFQAGISREDSDRILENGRGVSKEVAFHGLTRFVKVARESFFMGFMRRAGDNVYQNQA